MVEDLTFCVPFSSDYSFSVFIRFSGFYLIVGVDYDEDPPVPIPNTVVKLIRAENTWRAASRENRSMPAQRSSLELRCLFSPP